jgi:hypothetical protein
MFLFRDEWRGEEEEGQALPQVQGPRLRLQMWGRLQMQARAGGQASPLLLLHGHDALATLNTTIFTAKERPHVPSKIKPSIKKK